MTHKTNRTFATILLLVSLALFLYAGADIYFAALRTAEQYRLSSWYGYFNVDNANQFIAQCYKSAECKDGFEDLLWKNYRYYILIIFSVFFMAAVFMFSKGKKGLYHAGFSSGSDLKDMLMSRNSSLNHPLRSSVILGTFNGSLLGMKATKSKPELDHTLIVSPTRGGKGLMAITNLLSNKHSVVVVDPKGEMFHATAGHRSKFSDVFVIDPSGQGSKYDPIQDMGNTDESYFAAAALIMKAEQDGSSSVFAERASIGLVAAIVAARLLEQPTLPYIQSVTKWGVNHFITELYSLDNERVTTFLAQFAGVDIREFDPEALRDDRFLSSTYATLMTRLKDYLTEGILRTSSGHEFNATQLLRKPTTLYLRFSEGDLDSTMNYLRLVLLSIVTAIIKDADVNPDADNEPVLLMFDEAGRIAVPRLGNLVSTISSRGLAAMIFVQNLSQLTNPSAYGKEEGETIMANCQTQIFYPPRDYPTAKYISQMLGQHTYKQKAVSKGMGILADRRYMHSEVAREILTPDEVLTELKRDDIIIFRGYRKPIKAKRVMYFKEKWLNKLARQPTPEIKNIPQSNLVEFDELKPPPVAATEPIPNRRVQEQTAQYNVNDYIQPEDSTKETTLNLTVKAVSAEQDNSSLTTSSTTQGLSTKENEPLNHKSIYGNKDDLAVNQEQDKADLSQDQHSPERDMQVNFTTSPEVSEDDSQYETLADFEDYY